MPKGRLAAWGASALAAVMLAGCWGAAPVEATGLVVLLAIDAAPGGGYVITADVISPPGLPAPSPAGGGAGASPPVLVRQATGPSVFAAVRGLSLVSHLDLDFTHLEAVIVSAAVAREGLAPILQAFVESQELSEVGPWLLVARGSTAAATLEQTRTVVPYPGIVLDQLARWGRANSAYEPSHVWGFLTRLNLDGDQPFTAGVDVPVAQGSGKTATFGLTGLAMFQHGRLAGWLDGGAALGWAVATGRVRAQPLSAPGPAGPLTLELASSERRIRVQAGPGGPAVTILIRVTARLAGTNDARDDFYRQPRLLAAAQGQAAADLEADVAAALRAARAAGSDVFSLGQFVRVQDPRYWAQFGAEWGARGFRDLPVTSQVAVEINDVGLSVCPLFGPC